MIWHADYLGNYQRSHPGHDRGGKNWCQPETRIIRAVNRIDQPSLAASPTTPAPGAMKMETQGPAILFC